jgi:hypothetical protein
MSSSSGKKARKIVETVPTQEAYGFKEVKDFLAPTIDEPKKIDNTKKGDVCPNCGISL